MQKKLVIDFEEAVMNALLPLLPVTEEHKEFNRKYGGTEHNFSFEEDANLAFATEAMLAYKAGFRTAVALMQGRTKLIMDELLE